jgi:hypothetical protein
MREDRRDYPSAGQKSRRESRENPIVNVKGKTFPLQADGAQRVLGG